MYELIIEAGRSERQYWRDLWKFRELCYFLTWRDILVRYKQTVIGVAWAVIRPLLTMLIFTVIFHKVAKLPATGSAPYPLMVFSALLPWQFFAAGLAESSNSLLGSANLISKIYFPRLIIPISALITTFVDFLITLGLMALLMAWYGFWPDWRVLTLPIFAVLAFGAAFGGGVWFGALSVKYRDFRYIVPFVVQFGLFVSPVAFSSSVVPEQWRGLYALNPLVGVIEAFRWALLRGNAEFSPETLLVSGSVIGVLLWSGIRYFKATEKSFADVI